MNRATRRAGPVLLALLALAAGAASPASADIIRLKSGETIKGRVLTERSNEQVLVVEDFLAGGVRELSWGAVSAEDEDRIKTDLHINIVGDLTMACDVLTFRLAGGDEISVKGKIVGEDGEFVLLRNRSQKEPLKVAKSRIVGREAGECDPQEIFSPDELAEQYRAEVNAQDARGHFRLGGLCEAVGAYPQAKEAYENAAADEAFLNRKLAQDAVARVEAVIKDKAAVDTLGELKIAVSQGMWKRVRDGIEGFPTKHPDASEPIKKKLEELTADFKAKRTKAMSELAGRRLDAIIKPLIKKKVSGRETTYQDVQLWIRKEAIEETLAQLLKDMQAKDPAVTDKEAKEFWEARPKKASSWKLAKYGSGSFIVEPPKQLPKTGNKAPAQPQKGNNNGPAPTLKLPEPPTRDSWWKDASTDVRADFWFAAFVEKSSLYEVDPKKVRVPCSKCEGEGTTTLTLSSGGSATILCERCGGARFDYSIKYR